MRFAQAHQPRCKHARQPLQCIPAAQPRPLRPMRARAHSARAKPRQIWCAIARWLSPAASPAAAVSTSHWPHAVSCACGVWVGVDVLE